MVERRRDKAKVVSSNLTQVTVRPRSSAVERWFYTPVVGGSIPSADTATKNGDVDEWLKSPVC